MSRSLVFYTLVALWVALEFWLGRRRRSGGGQASRDDGTLRLLHRVIGASVFLAVLAAYTGWLHWPQPLQPVLSWAGIALMAGGLLLRWISVRTLDRWFTVDVAVRDDQRLIQHGPYRWLRHPSYTGALMLFLGMGLALGNVLSLVVLMLPVPLAFLRRIHVEEAALAAHFGEAWTAHARRTWRLVPFVW